MPVFAPDGRYLAFVLRGNEQPFVSDRDDESLISTLNSDGVYIAPLSRETTHASGAEPSSAPSSRPGRMIVILTITAPEKSYL